MDSEMSNQSLQVPSDLAIHSPSEFQSLLQRLLRLLNDGVLKQCDLADASTGSLDVRWLQPDGPWPDIVEAEFVGVDGRRYHLFVDTYHGAGGHWRVLT
jgi:hypothetical protein